MNNNRRKESVSVRPLIIVLFVLLLCLPAISVISDISISDTPAVLDKQIKSDGRVHYRFRRIYNGSDVSAHHTNGGNVTNLPTYSGKTTSWQKATVSNGASATELSLPMSGSAGSSSMALHTSSSASMHSLGGGASIGASHTNVSGTHSSMPSMAYSATAMPSFHYNMPSTSLLAQNPTSSQGHAAAGPRRAGEYIWGDILYGEDDEEIGTVDGSGNVWKDGVIIGTFIGGNFTSQGEAVDNPIGAPWILLFFAAAFALFTYIRKNKISSLPMKHNTTKILILLSFLSLALPQAWGRTIYLNTSSASSPYNSTQWWVHIWGGTGGGNVAMTTVAGESNIYQAEIGDHTNIIFVPNNGTGSNWSNQTNNIEGIPNDKNCYNITGKSSGTWSTYAAPVPTEYTIYFKNTVNWSNIYVHFYGSSYSLSGNGATGSGAAKNCGAMTRIDETQYYSLTFTSFEKYTKVCFTKDQQDSYGNFWQTEASYSNALDLDGSTLLWIPNPGESETKNTNVPYYAGEWRAYPECTIGAFTIAQPGNGRVGDHFDMNPNITAGSGTITYTCSPAGVVSFVGNTATYEQAANPVSITATLNGAGLCAPVQHTTNNFMIEAAAPATTYGLVLQSDGWTVHNMAEDAGTWSYTYSSVAAGTYSLAISSDVSNFNPNKISNTPVTINATNATVTKDGGGIDFNVTTAATGNIEITYTPATNTLTVTAAAPVAHTWEIWYQHDHSLGSFVATGGLNEYRLDAFELSAENHSTLCFKMDGTTYYIPGSSDLSDGQHQMNENAGGYFEWTGGNYGLYRLTISMNAGNWQVTAEERAADPITDLMVAPIYYIYLGEAYHLPEGYTYASSSLGTNTLETNTFTANQLGEYDVRVSKVGFSPKDIKVRVYRYYVKHAWGWTGAASTSNPQYNAAWVWEPLAYVDATHASYTGTGGNLATNGANLCWDYTYDWAGVYQTDADAACNFHPGLDNDSKQGKWGAGAHECDGGLANATTGATTWKPQSFTQGTIYDFIFNETLSGSTEPTNNTSHLSISGTSKTTYAVNFTAITNTSVSNDGGYITSTLGTISGVKALNNTAVTFTAHTKNGYTFKGWYSNEACTSLLTAAPTYSTAVSGAAIQVYAKFVEPQFFLHAEWNGWAASLSQFKFTKVSATQYSYTIPAVAMTESLDEFLVRDENGVTVYSWKTANCGTNVVSNGNDAYPNFKLNFSGFCSVTIQIDINPETDQATVSATYTQNPDIYIGSGSTLFTGYYWGTAVKMTHEPGSNVYTYSHSCKTTDEIHFTLRIGSDIDASSAVFEPGHITSFTINNGERRDGGSNHAFKLNADNYRVTITLTVSGANATIDVHTEPIEEDITIRIRNDIGWAAPTIHFWNAKDADNNSISGTTWGSLPALSREGETNWYTYTIEGAVKTKFLIRDATTTAQTSIEPQINEAGTYCYILRNIDENKLLIADPTCNAEILWYLIGSDFGNSYHRTSVDYPFEHIYRGIENMYYREVTKDNDDTKYAQVHNLDHRYGLSSTSALGYGYTNANQLGSTNSSSPNYNFNGTYWICVDATGTYPKMWYQEPQTYHHVTITEIDAANYGEYTLTTTSTGAPANAATNLFANGENYLLTITAVNSGVTPHITVNGEEESLSQSGDVYTYEGTMPGGDITIAITYDVVKDFTFETRVNGTSVTETDFGRTIVVHTENPINFSSTPGYQYTYSLDGGSSWRIVDAGTYVINSFGTANIIKFRARGSDDSFATYVEKIINVTIPAATVSLSHSGSASVGETLTLTATANISGGTYTFYVTAPGEAAPTSVYSGPNNTYNYVLPVEGHYVFSVNVADANEPHIYNASAADAVDVTPDTYYLRYNFVNDAENFGNRSLNNVPMTYNAADGTYYYYHPTVTDDGFYMPISSYNYDVNQRAAVMTTNRAAVAADWKTIHNNEVPYVANNTICVFHYDPNRDYVWITSVTTNYRVKSVGTNGTFYSNSIKSAGEKISFYASTDATLSWQTSDDGGASWADAGAISTRAASNGVWVAEPSALDATTLTLTAYTGAYYVNNTALSKQEMTDFTSTSTTYYDHYCVAYLTASTNVGATLGNTINTNLATRMPWYTLPSAANVRYEYTPRTNAFTRTLISGSSTDDFAQIYGVADGEIYQTDGSTQIVKTSALKLDDGSDWVYTADFKVKTTGGAIYAKLTGGYNGSQQWILARTGEEGADDAKTLICGDRTTNGTYSFRLIYDYKTNQCISGWNPSDLTISSDISMNANFFVIRDALNSSTLQFIDLGGHNVDILKSIIFVLDIDRDELFNSDNSPKHALGSRLFQVTLPYNITMGKIFGLPNYGTDWVIQDYKGELRKNLGYDGSSDFWATLLWSPATTLKEGRGYVVSTTYNYESFREFGSTAKKYLYFPTSEITGGYSLSAIVRDTTYSELKCKKAGREEYDSDWRSIGARSFYPTKMSTNGNDDGHTLDYFYEWDGTYGNYTAWALEERVMQPTRNYMIQYHGKAQWTKQSSPSSVVARRVNGVNVASKYRIELQDLSGKMLDQTYIKLSADGNDSYVIGHDLSKSFSDEAPQIYSITAGNELAGNNVADSTTFVKLGISLPESGEYVISLGNNGQEKQAILYDREQDRFTNLSYGASYSFTGIAGKQGERFYIRFAPASPETPTDADEINTSKMSVTNMGDQLLINGLSTESPLLLYSPSGQLIYQATPAAEGLSIPAPSTAGVYLLRCGKETTRILIK